MAALLAWPAYLPLTSRETPNPVLVVLTFKPPSVAIGFQRPESSNLPGQTDRSVVSDDSEEWDGRNDSRYSPIAITYPPADLPSLVPSSLAMLTIGPIDRIASFVDS